MFDDFDLDIQKVDVDFVAFGATMGCLTTFIDEQSFCICGYASMLCDRDTRAQCASLHPCR